MKADEFTQPAAPQQAVPLDASADRFVALLDLPGSDPEVRDIAAILHAALKSARETDHAELLDDALQFAQGRLVVRGLGHATISELGAALETASAQSLAAGVGFSVEALLARCRASQSTSPDQVVLDPVTSAYVDHLMKGDRRGAIELTRRCVSDGMSILDILLAVLEPAQHEVGRRWALGLISIAHEHFCTAVTQFVMTDLCSGLFDGEDSHRRLLAVHVPGSLHHVGLRMVVDVLECRDWSTTYVVDEVTVDSLPGLVADDQADLLLISAAMPNQISQVKAMIQAVRGDPRTRGVKVVVGGRPFGIAPGLVGEVGADGWARDARTAIDVCNNLMEDIRDTR